MTWISYEEVLDLFVEAQRYVPRRARLQIPAAFGDLSLSSFTALEATEAEGDAIARAARSVRPEWEPKTTREERYCFTCRSVRPLEDFRSPRYPGRLAQACVGCREKCNARKVPERIVTVAEFAGLPRASLVQVGIARARYHAMLDGRAACAKAPSELVRVIRASDVPRVMRCKLGPCRRAWPAS